MSNSVAHIGKYVALRLLACVPVLLVVSLIVFGLAHLAPGDPALLMADDHASASELQRLREILGIHLPGWQQFLAWLASLAEGNFGKSLFSGIPVAQLMMQRVEPTLSIAVITMAGAISMSVPLGTLAACHEGSWIDLSVSAAAAMFVCTPVFIIGYLLIYGVALPTGWFPVQGYASLRAQGVTAWLRSLVLPCITLLLPAAALMIRMTRATVLESLREDFIRTALAKGLGPVAVAIHALRAAAVPIFMTAGTIFALLLGGVVVTETVFSVPGLGRLVVDAVTRRDYPVIQGVLLMSACACVLVNLLVDLGVRLFDPRVGT